MSLNVDQQLQQSLDQLLQIQTAAVPIMAELMTLLETLTVYFTDASPLADLTPDFVVPDQGLGNLQTQINELKATQQRLQRPVLRLLVLGDVKRGKSTVINAMLGAEILPSAPNPCTAVITVLRYGSTAQVTLHFHDGRSPEKLTLEDFHHRYTLSATRSDAAESEPPFGDISHAVIEYPSPLLQAAVEIVDSPGLNDTEYLNQRSLQYLSTCHAVLFVMRAIQPCTLTEQRYIHTHLEGKGMTPFFLLNGWDEIQDSLLDPNDPNALTAAEVRLQQVFQASLQDYIASESEFNLATRMFPMSALRSLRHYLNGGPVDSGFTSFVTVLTQFVSLQRTEAQLRPLLALSRTVQQTTTQQTADYLAGLDYALNQSKQSVMAAATPFEDLATQKEQFKSQLQQQLKPIAVQLADSIKHHFNQANSTFTQDFSRYQPPLQLVEQLNPMAWQTYHKQLETAFQKYLTDQLERWRATAVPQLKITLASLAGTAAPYGQGHRTVVYQILENIQLPTPSTVEAIDWIDWANDLFSTPAEITNAALHPLQKRLDALPLSLWSVAYGAVQTHLHHYVTHIVARIDRELSQAQQQIQQQLTQHQTTEKQYRQIEQQLHDTTEKIARACNQLDRLCYPKST